MRFSELRYKEVICVSTGQRLGYVCDAELDPCTGKILSLIVPGQARFFGLLGREEVRGISLHNYQVNGLPLGLTLSVMAQDGVIEGIERGDSILGVQFHPEVEREFDCLFADLVEKSRAYGRGGPGDCISPRAAD